MVTSGVLLAASLSHKEGTKAVAEADVSPPAPAQGGS